MSILVIGESVPAEFFTALTPSGAHVVFAYGQAVAFAMPDGTCYKRFKLCEGNRGQRVDVALQIVGELQRWNGQMTVRECSEFEWQEVEREAQMPQPPRIKLGIEP